MAASQPKPNDRQKFTEQMRLLAKSQALLPDADDTDSIRAQIAAIDQEEKEFLELLQRVNRGASFHLATMRKERERLSKALTESEQGSRTSSRLGERVKKVFTQPAASVDPNQGGN